MFDWHLEGQEKTITSVGFLVDSRERLSFHPASSLLGCANTTLKTLADHSGVCTHMHTQRVCGATTEHNCLDCIIKHCCSYHWAFLLAVCSWSPSRSVILSVWSSSWQPCAWQGIGMRWSLGFLPIQGTPWFRDTILLASYYVYRQLPMNWSLVLRVVSSNFLSGLLLVHISHHD